MFNLLEMCAIFGEQIVNRLPNRAGRA